MLKSFRNVSLFQNLTDEQIDRLSHMATKMICKPGEIFIREGTLERKFYVILEGNIEISKLNGRKSYHLTTLHEGDTVGEMIFFSHAPRSASAKALDNATLLCFDLSHIEEEKYADIFLKFSFFIGEKVSDRLRYMNEVTLETMKHRIAGGHFAINIIANGFLYIISLEVIQILKPLVPTATPISLALIVMFCYFSVRMIKHSGYSRRDFGITLDNWKKNIIESIFYSLVIMAGLLLLKICIVAWVPAFHSLKIFDPMAIFSKTTPMESITLKNYFLTMTAYVTFSPLQEFITRGSIQSALQKFLPTKKNHSTSTWRAIFLANLIFAQAHAHLSWKFTIAAFFAGMFWGWLFARQKSLLGVCVSHILIGCWALFVLGFNNFL